MNEVLYLKVILKCMKLYCVARVCEKFGIKYLISEEPVPLKYLKKRVKHPLFSDVIKGTILLTIGIYLLNAATHPLLQNYAEP